MKKRRNDAFKLETTISCPLSEMQLFWYKRLLLRESSLLKELEKANAKELRAWKKQMDEAAAELSAATKQNTEKLQRVAELTAAQHRLERELNSTQSRMVAEVGPSKEKMKAEREQLVSLVKLQAREMEALKAEINMLRRKG